MKRALLLLCLTSVAFAAGDKPIPVSQLESNPKAFDGKTVVVTGPVVKSEARTSGAGNHYTTMTVGEKSTTVSVYVRGTLTPLPKKGDKVLVTGTYSVEKKVGNLTFKNELDATPMGKRKGEVMILPGTKCKFADGKASL